MRAIVNATLVMCDHLIPEAFLLIENGRIEGFGEMRHASVPDGCEKIDAEGLFVGPGLIDIHTHASDRVFFIDDPAEAAQYHLRHGTTTVFPALYFSMDLSGWLESIRIIREGMKDPRCKVSADCIWKAPISIRNSDATRRTIPGEDRSGGKNTCLS